MNPVSYTHLDVYKRQVKNSALAVPTDILLIRADKKITTAISATPKTR